MLGFRRMWKCKENEKWKERKKTQISNLQNKSMAKKKSKKQNSKSSQFFSSKKIYQNLPDFNREKDKLSINSTNYC